MQGGDLVTSSIPLEKKTNISLIISNLANPSTANEMKLFLTLDKNKMVAVFF